MVHIWLLLCEGRRYRAYWYVPQYLMYCTDPPVSKNRVPNWLIRSQTRKSSGKANAATQSCRTSDPILSHWQNQNGESFLPLLLISIRSDFQEIWQCTLFGCIEQTEISRPQESRTIFIRSSSNPSHGLFSHLEHPLLRYFFILFS